MQNNNHKQHPDTLKQVAVLYGFSSVPTLMNNLSDETVKELEKLSQRKKGKKLTPKMLEVITKDLGELKSN